MMEYVAKGLGGDAGQIRGGQRTNNRKSIGRVVLPIPAGINDSNQVSWQSCLLYTSDAARRRG